MFCERVCEKPSIAFKNNQSIEVFQVKNENKKNRNEKRNAGTIKLISVENGLLIWNCYMSSKTDERGFLFLTFTSKIESKLINNNKHSSKIEQRIHVAQCMEKHLRKK